MSSLRSFAGPRPAARSALAAAGPARAAGRGWRGALRCAAVGLGVAWAPAASVGAPAGPPGPAVAAAQGATTGAQALSPERRAELQAALKACVEAELQSRAAVIDAAWAPIAPRAAEAGAVARAATRAAVERLVAEHGGQKVRCANEAAWRVAPVDAPGLRAAQAWLAQPPTPLGPGDVGARWVGGEGYPLRLLPAGTHTIGCTPGQLPDCGGDEQPTRAVTLSRWLFVGEVEVTQALYAKIMGRNPAFHATCGESCPVEQVSWLDALLFANALSKAEGLEECYRVRANVVSWPEGTACLGYRLPTEAEWEVAARGGQDLRFAGAAEADGVAWTWANSGGLPHPVGQKAPNGYGLFDMSGNVTEWTWDTYAAAAYAEGPATDPLGAGGPTGSGRRVLRGGSWRLEPDSARVANRNEGPAAGVSKHLGLRLVRTAG